MMFIQQFINLLIYFNLIINKFYECYILDKSNILKILYIIKLLKSKF